MDLKNKKIIALGERDGVQGSAIALCVQSAGAEVVLDVTHSLQLPGAAGGASGGQPEFIEPLAAAGVAAGVVRRQRAEPGNFFGVEQRPVQRL